MVFLDQYIGVLMVIAYTSVYGILTMHICPEVSVSESDVGFCWQRIVTVFYLRLYPASKVIFSMKVQNKGANEFLYDTK